MMWVRWIVALVLALGAGPTAFGQCADGRCFRPMPARRAVVYPVQQPVYAAPQAIAAPQAAVYQGDDAGAFLARLNAWRAQYGRGPLGWDATLAVYAKRNSWAGHAPWSMAPGAGQCWASNRSLVAALDAWIGSPPHAAILLNASIAVGASLCPSGSTCNAM